MPLVSPHYQTARSATYVLAASNASDRMKNEADTECSGDGDQEQINAAVAALPSVGGKVVLSEGDFTLAAPVTITRDNVTLEGMGHGTPAGGWNVIDVAPATGGTRIVVPASFTGTAAIECRYPGGVRMVFGTQLRDFAINGFSAPASTIGIYHAVTRGKIEDVFVQYMPGHGLYSTAYRTDPETLPVATAAPFDNFYTNVRFRNNGGHGMYFEDTSTDHILMGVILERSGGDGLRLHGATYTSTAMQLHGGYIYSNAGRGITASAWQFKLYNTRVQDNETGGLYLTGAWGGGFQVVGGSYRNNSIAADNTYDAINIAPTAVIQGGLITGVDFYADVGLDNAALTRQRYGISIENANMHDLVIGPNSFGHKNAASVFGTAYIRDLGTGTKISGDGATVAPVRHTLTEEFGGGTATAGTIGEYGWTFANGTVTRQAAEAGHPGIVRRATSAAAGTIAALYLGNFNSAFHTADLFDVTWFVRLTQTDTDTMVRFGVLNDTGNLLPGSMICIEKRYADTNWFYTCRSATVETRTNSGVAVAAATWVRLRLWRSGATIRFSINGVAEAAVATNLPSIAATYCSQIANQSAVDKSLDYDAVTWAVSGLNR